MTTDTTMIGLTQQQLETMLADARRAALEEAIGRVREMKREAQRRLMASEHPTAHADRVNALRDVINELTRMRDA